MDAFENHCPPTRYSSDSVVLKANPSPVVYAGPDDSVQYGERVILGMEAWVKSGTEPYSYSWVKSGTNNALNADKTQLIMQTSRLTYTTVFDLKVVDSVGCTAQDDVTVKVLGGPFRLDTIKPFDITLNEYRDTICVGDSVSFTARPEGGSGVYKYIWEVPAGTVVSDRPEIRLLPLQTTFCKVTVINVTEGAANASDTLVRYPRVVVHQRAVPGYITTPDTTMCPDTAFMLTLNNHFGDRIKWERSVNGVVWNTLDGTDTTINIAGTKTTYLYRALVGNGVCFDTATPQL